MERKNADARKGAVDASIRLVYRRASMMLTLVLASPIRYKGGVQLGNRYRTSRSTNPPLDPPSRNCHDGDLRASPLPSLAHKNIAYTSGTSPLRETERLSCWKYTYSCSRLVTAPRSNGRRLVTGRKGRGRTGGMSLLFGMEMEFTDGKFVLFVARARARARARDG